MIVYSTGEDIFDMDVKLIVNPVNTVGVMGKGLANEFKMKYPDMALAYMTYCSRGLLGIGENLYFHDESGKIICCMPTKKHWKNPSKLNYVLEGMDNLVEYINTDHTPSVAIPRIGCGCGGLNWDEVKPLIVERLKNVYTDTVIHILE